MLNSLIGPYSLILSSYLQMQQFDVVCSLKCKNGTIVESVSVDTMIDGKCGVWRKGTSEQQHTMIASCFCSKDNCNNASFVQDRISAALADTSGSAWAASNLEDMELERSSARIGLLECLRKNVKERSFQNVPAGEGPPSTIERKISLGSWALIAAIILLLFVCVIFFIVTRRGTKIQNDMKSSGLSIVELEFSEKDGVYNKKNLIGKLRTPEEQSDSVEGSKERDDNGG
ncbi:hypothetical protein Aduo_017493 [Ancylostoma duodenale]